MNDPNGMVFYDGEYHLFYQYYPDSTVWGPMHWGHAVSRDLVLWQHLPIALSPDSLGYIFSGSAVVDWKNTSGFGTGGEPPLVAVFTYHDPGPDAEGVRDRETQGIAYSTDRGRTWTKYAGNPVLPNVEGHRDFRDPNVFWHEPSGRWVMALSVHDHVELWGSPDLREWSYLSSFGREWGAHGGTWECPDLFPLTLDATGETKWVLIQNLNPGGPQGGSGTQYFVGDFDGTTFTLDDAFASMLRTGGIAWLDWGRDDYAGVTWSDAPGAPDSRIFIGWMSNWDYAQQVPTAPWRSAMTLPRTLRLQRAPTGYRIVTEPVAQLQVLRGMSASLVEMPVTGSRALDLPFPVATSELELAWAVGGADSADFGVELSNGLGERYRIGYDGASGDYYSDRRAAGDHTFSDAFADRVHHAPRLARGDTVRMHLYFDVASVELFADGGVTTLTDIFFPTEPFDRIALYAEGGTVVMAGGRVWVLRGIW